MRRSGRHATPAPTEAADCGSWYHTQRREGCATAGPFVRSCREGGAVAKSIVSEPGAAVAGVAAPTRRENDGLEPPLVAARPLPARLVLVLLVPALFGGICGWALRLHQTAYLT